MSDGWTVPASQGQTATAPAPSPTPAERDTALLAWRSARDKLAAAKEEEMTARTRIVTMLFPTPVKGTQRYDLGGGWSVKFVHKINYNLDKEATEDALDSIEKFGKNEAEKAVNALIADRLVKFKPELSITEYKQLPPELKKLIDAVITETPGAPELSIEEPKAK